MAQYLPGIALPKGDRLQRLRCEETSERQAESRWFPVAQVHPQLRGMQIGSIAHNGQARHRGSPPHSEDCLWSEIGRASCRERVCQFGEDSGVGVSLKKKR